MDAMEQDGPFKPIGSAPQDGRLLIGRLADGETHLMRWRSKPRIVEEDGPEEQREHPYWARWHTDNPIEPVEWAPTRLTMEDVLDWV